MTWKRRKRSADPEVPTDPAVFLEGGVPGKYKCVSMLKEQHGEHLYCVSVCALRADHARLFATVGANRASVYRLEDDGGVTLLRAFADDNADEQYFACAWCEASSGELLLALAGHTGVVRVLDVSAAATKKKRGDATETASVALFRDLRGHGGSVNDVRAHPCAPHLLLSASKDLSCRLWNVDNGVCVFIFSGALGHRNDVLSVDIKPTPLFSSFDDKKAKAESDESDESNESDFVFVSGAMDNMVKVWSTRGYSHLLELSERWPEQQKKENDGKKKRPRRRDETAFGAPRSARRDRNASFVRRRRRG
jgi:polycomb protein EED